MTAPDLTPAEWLVLRHAATGETLEQTAAALGVERRTLYNQRSAAYRGVRGGRVAPGSEAAVVTALRVIAAASPAFRAASSYRREARRVRRLAALYEDDDPREAKRLRYLASIADHAAANETGPQERLP